MITVSDLIDFLSDPKKTSLENVEIDEPSFIKISDKFFNFSSVTDRSKEKELKNIEGSNLSFERCIITGALMIRNCDFESIRFKNCHFINPDFGTKPSSFFSVDIISTRAKTVSFIDSFFGSPIACSQTSHTSLTFDHVTCPILWLQSTHNTITNLRINRFLGESIHLPDEQPFKTLSVDHLTFPLIKGSTSNSDVYLVKL